jgi:hypothetical protein
LYFHERGIWCECIHAARERAAHCDHDTFPIDRICALKLDCETRVA